MGRNRRPGLRAIAALFCASFGGGCAATPQDALVLTLLHRAEEGDTLGGENAESYAKAAELTVEAVSPDWWLTQDVNGESPWRRAVRPPADQAGYLPVARVNDHILWRRPDALSPNRVAVTEVPKDAERLDDEVLLGWRNLEPDGVSEAVLGELYFRPPQSMPLNVCVQLSRGEHVFDAGMLLDGRAPFRPGGQQNAIFRHRVFVPVPKDASSPESQWSVQLASCTTGKVFRTAETHIAMGNRRITTSLLRGRGGVSDPEARFEQPASGRVGLRTSPDGVVPVPGPPLPRMRSNEASPVLVVGSVNPMGWHLEEMGTPSGPLSKAAPWLSGPGTTWLIFDAPASRLGQTVIRDRTRKNPPRRVLPEILGGVRNSGVDGLVLASDHVLDAGPMGLAETERAARSQGLRVASWGTSASHFPYVLGSERRVAGLLPWNADASGAWDTLEQEISHLRTSVDVLLVHVQHEGDFASRQAIARRIVAQDVDAVWFVGGNTPGPVEVRDGTPVVYGVPSLFGEKENLGLGLRWYLGDTGVVRLDLLALTTRNKQLTRAPVARARKLLERLQRESRRLSTDVRLGQQVAAVDVANHGLRKPPRLAVPYDEEVMRPPKGSLAPANQPPRCDGDTWLGNSELNLPIGEHLILRGATVRPLSGNEHKPVQVELLWERRVESEGTLPRGLVRWSGVGNGVAWRGRFVPCDGSWGFEWWKPGDRVRDEVWLFPDTPQAGQEVEVFLTVEMGKEVQRGPRGERKIRIGSFVLE